MRMMYYSVMTQANSEKFMLEKRFYVNIWVALIKIEQNLRDRAPLT